jgi:hypothetical protein
MNKKQRKRKGRGKMMKERNEERKKSYKVKLKESKEGRKKERNVCKCSNKHTARY